MASKRAIRRRACLGKRCYRTMGDALTALRRHSKRYGRMTPYRCRFCRQYHLGHPPRKIREAIAARQAASLFHA